MTLEKKLKENGHEVFIFTIDPETPDKLVSPNIIYFKGFTVPIKKINSYRLSLKTYFSVHIIKKYNLDVLHLQTEFSMGRLAILASRKYKIPMVYTLHTLYEDYLQYVSKTIDNHFHKGFLASLAKILIAPINKRAIIKIVPSRKTLSMISKYYINGDVRVVPTGLDLKFLVKKKISDTSLNDLRKKLGISDKDLVCLSLGRVSEEKSIDVLIRSFNEAYKKNPNLTLLIVGSGPSLENLKSLATSLEAKEKIKFTGFVKWQDIVPYYQLADCFLNASTTETQGLTYIESLACGTPIVVKQDEVLSDIVVEAENGFYFNDECELTNLLIKFSEDFSILRKMKNTTYNTVLKFDEDIFADNICKIYVDAIEKAKIKKRRFFTKI